MISANATILITSQINKAVSLIGDDMNDFYVILNENRLIIPEKIAFCKVAFECYNSGMEKKNQPVFIVGLGNPGEQYANTPRSAGFMVVDEFARRLEFPDFKMEPDGIMTAQKEIDGTCVILAKPQMLMNNSGKATTKLFAHKKVRRMKSYPNLWVINDDLDIPLGKIKIGKNRGSAGHKGVQSIIDQLKTKNFVRFRIGIQTPEVAGKLIPPHKFVLKKITSKERGEFDKAVELAIDALKIALTEGLDKSMTVHNQ